jgi:hypothetical protein
MTPILLEHVPQVLRELFGQHALYQTAGRDRDTTQKLNRPAGQTNWLLPLGQAATLDDLFRCRGWRRDYDACWNPIAIAIAVAMDRGRA